MLGFDIPKELDAVPGHLVSVDLVGLSSRQICAYGFFSIVCAACMIFFASLRMLVEPSCCGIGCQERLQVTEGGASLS